MKKEILITILLTTFLFIGKEVFSQRQAWSFILDDKANTKCIDLDETTINDHIITAAAFNSGSGKQFAVLLKINHEGVLNDTVHITSQQTSISPVSTYVDSNNSLTFIGLSYDTILHNNAALIRIVFDSKLEITERKVAVLPIDLVIGGFFQSTLLSDSSVLVYATVISSTSKLETTLVCHLDKYFNFLKYNIPAPNQWGTYLDMRQLNDSTFWVLQMMSPKYLKLDASFNIIGQSPIPRYFSTNSSCKWVNDSTFYLLGKNNYPLPEHNIAIVKQFHPFDTTGHLFWRWHHTDTIDFPSVYKGIDFKHPDTIFAGGTHNLDRYNPHYAHHPSWLVVLQTDSMLNLRWERFYGGDAYYVMSNLIATNDGGCLVGGWRFDYQNSTENQTDIILLKLNSEGLLTGINNPTTIQLREAIVYPNPGSSQLKVRLAIQHPQALFQLFDQGGRLVMQQQLTTTESELETNHLTAGIYVYRITSSTGLNENGKWVKQ